MTDEIYTVELPKDKIVLILPRWFIYLFVGVEAFAGAVLLLTHTVPIP